MHDLDAGMRPDRRRLVAGLAALAATLAMPARARSETQGEGMPEGLTLFMYRRAGCPWCRAWDREIGTIYGQSDIGRAVPIVMIDMDRGEEAPIALVRPVRFTPTFVLGDGTAERARIEGYPGEDFFWGLLERMVREAGVETGA